MKEKSQFVFGKIIADDDKIKIKTRIRGKPQKLERYLIIFDDVLGDAKISGFHSGIANYCTRS